MCRHSGGTRQGELQRSAELFVELCGREDRGPFYALALLYDSQYDRHDIKEIIALMYDRKLGFKGV